MQKAPTCQAEAFLSVGLSCQVLDDQCASHIACLSSKRWRHSCRPSRSRPFRAHLQACRYHSRMRRPCRLSSRISGLFRCSRRRRPLHLSLRSKTFPCCLFRWRPYASSRPCLCGRRMPSFRSKNSLLSLEWNSARWVLELWIEARTSRSGPESKQQAWVSLERVSNMRSCVQTGRRRHEGL